MQRAILSFLLFLMFAFWLQIRVKKASKGRYKDIDQFIDDERKANAVRKVDIDETYFLKIDKQRLPVRAYDENDRQQTELFRLQEKALYHASQKMIKFENPMSNNDIKMAFGAANLEVVTGYEEQFNRYVSALLAWAQALMSADENVQNNTRYKEDAKQILKHSIDIKSDYTKSFTLLAELYAGDNDKESLVQLLRFVSEAQYLQRKDKIVQDLQDLINKTGGI